MTTEFLTRFHRDLAYRFHVENPQRDANDNWLIAEREIIEQVAYQLGQFPNRKDCPPNENWNCAEVNIQWQQWVEDTFKRPYLAIETTRNCDVLRELLEAPDHQPSNQTIFLLSISDGAPEFSREKFGKHRNNCVDPYELIEAKDRTFFDFCYHSISVYDGVIYGSENTDSVSPNLAQNRLFQDGCAVSFSNTETITQLICNAMGSALYLNRSLNNFNIEKNLCWIEQLHARTVIGSSWLSVLQALRNTRRGEIRLDRETFQKLPSCSQSILLSLGVRATQYSNEDSSFSDLPPVLDVIVKECLDACG